MLFSINVFTLSACIPNRIRPDQAQTAATDTSPALGAQRTIAQSFVAIHDNLTAAEIMPATLPPHKTGPYPEPIITLTLRSGENVATEVATDTVALADLRGGQFHRFSFSLQPHSAGRQYTLQAAGVAGSPVTLWQSSLDLYAGGQVSVDNMGAPGDLTFRTFYTEDGTLLLRYLINGLLHNGWLALPLLVVLFLPGYVGYGLILPDAEPALPDHLALSFGLSLAMIPLAYLWARVFGLHVSRYFVIALSVVLVAMAARQLYGRGWRDPHRRRKDLHQGSPFFIILWAGVLLLTIAVRYLEIRDQVLPLWVDSVFHTSVTQLFMQQGGIPTTYRPMMPIDRFIYHFGFHALAATFAWLTNLPVPRVLLGLGQALNALLLLPLYLLLHRWTGRRTAGLMAMLLAGLVSLMPAYYVSWGRYTQLAGLALLPVAMLATTELLESSRLSFRNLLFATLIVSGLVLTHYRVLVYYACFVVAFMLLHTATSGRKSLRAWQRVSLLTVAVIVLTAPWLINLSNQIVFPLSSVGHRLTGTAAYNVFPWEFVWIRHNGTLFALAAAGIIWAIIRRNHKMLVIPLWVALVGLVANPNLLGLRPLWLINNATAVISLFIPLAILGSYVLAGGFAMLCQHIPPRGRRPLQGAAGLILLLVGLWGAWGLSDVINPVTVMATADDRVALAWVQHNTPPDAHFLINARFWQNKTYTGSDGGYWLTPLTGRSTTLPMAHYTYGSREEAGRITAFAKQVTELSSVDDPAFLRRLREQGVTHAYVGAMGGVLTPAKLVASPHFEPVYHHGAAWVFAFHE